MLARRNAPFTLLDDPYFQWLLSKTYKDIKLFGSRHFARFVLPRVASDIIQKLVLEVGDRNFTITTDGWTMANKPSPSFYRQYFIDVSNFKCLVFCFSLTLHYCRDDFIPQKVLFGVTEITESTSTENIRNALTDYMKFIGLNPEKIACVVRDDAANVKNAAKSLTTNRFACF